MALVIDPNRRRADRLAGNLTGLGYGTLAVRDGKSAMRAVLANPDIELILLSAQTYEPRSSELLQELRHDYRARRLPLALLSDEPKHEALADRFDTVVRFPHPMDFDSTEILVRRLVALSDEDDLTCARAPGGCPTIAAATVRFERKAGRACHIRPFPDSRAGRGDMAQSIPAGTTG